MVKLTGQELEQAKKERADFVTLQRDRLVKIDQAMKNYARHSGRTGIRL